MEGGEGGVGDGENSVEGSESNAEDSDNEDTGSSSDSDEGGLTLAHFKNFAPGTAVFYPGAPAEGYPGVGETGVAIYVGRVVGVYVKGGKKHKKGLETVFMEPVVQGQWGGEWADSTDGSTKKLFPPVTVQPEDAYGMVVWGSRPEKAGGECSKTLYYKGVMGEDNWRVMCETMIADQPVSAT